MNTKHRFEFCAGVLGCLVWPILFGYIMADNNWGKWGIHCGLAVMVVIMYFVVHCNDTVFKYLARGSWVLALVSLLPIIPMQLGGWLIQETRAMFGVVSHVDEGPPLNFPIALVVTMAYSIVYVVGSLIIGWMVYKYLNRNGSNQSFTVSA